VSALAAPHGQTVDEANTGLQRRGDRPGPGATPEPPEEWTFDMTFRSVGEFPDAFDRAFAVTGLMPAQPWPSCLARRTRSMK
jgi:hypothetical protein